MKVLFIFKCENFIAPLGPAVISAVAQQEGYNTYLCEMNSEDPVDAVKRLKPDVVAYSASTGEHKHYVKVNERIKKVAPNIFTIMGGPHTTFYPNLVNKSDLDAVCVGEGEFAFAKILTRLRNGRSLEGIPNIITPGKATACDLHHFVDPLDDLPFPDYALFYDNTSMGEAPLKSFITSRGCPYNCTYCFNYAWKKKYNGKGNYVRRFSVDYVLEDIRRVKSRWPLSCVKFYDDIFVFKVDSWLEEFARKYPKQVGLPFFILTRADLLTEEAVKLLKSSGCRTISMSIEAGNDRVRNQVLKRKMKKEDLIKAHQLCDKYGIYTFTNSIIGLPGTSIDEDLESFDLSLDCKVDWGEFLQFHPYPGTQLGDETIKKGYYTPDYDGMHTSYQYRSPLNCFTDKDKDIQANLALLGPVALVIPELRHIISNYLLFMPPNPLFTMAYYLAKQYALRRKIYVTDTSLKNSIAIFLRSLKQDFFRHREER